MASLMFLGFLSQQKPVFEDRIDKDLEAPGLRNLWKEMEQECFEKYIGEVDDDQLQIHPYVLLKHEITQCRHILVHDNRREVMKTCHNAAFLLHKRCMHGLLPASNAKADRRPVLPAE
eukprot:NODE_23751_length_652_cov_7.428571.p3 GENE.NODE_23751_length_652_cov_7.428571~~NODE_23751_length_652_cov_7.428571.p3  ORF type:complete len:118 (-),score=37.71 NODE_23751_length_652_cov_7.428571:103-456(-)